MKLQISKAYGILTPKAFFKHIRFFKWGNSGQNRRFFRKKGGIRNLARLLQR
jgi:hypothetical protein